ncbi:RimK family alpha-L-glutamate ligase, partial [Planctomycetota bacterium]
KLRIGIIVDGRRRPLYQKGLVERLVHAFGRCDVTASVIDLCVETPATDYDLYYPLPVVYSARLESFLRELAAQDLASRIFNPPDVQLATLDKTRTVDVLRKTSVPFPETLVTNDSAAAMSFISHHGYVIMKSVSQAAGLGHVVVKADASDLYAWVPDIRRHRQLALNSDVGMVQKGLEAGRRLRLQLDRANTSSYPVRPIDGGTYFLHAPFLIQRLVRSGATGGVLDRVYRVYVIGGVPAFGALRIMKGGLHGDLSRAVVSYAWGGGIRVGSAATHPCGGG